MLAHLQRSLRVPVSVLLLQVRLSARVVHLAHADLLLHLIAVLHGVPLVVSPTHQLKLDPDVHNPHQILRVDLGIFFLLARAVEAIEVVEHPVSHAHHRDKLVTT